MVQWVAVTQDRGDLAPSCPPKPFQAMDFEYGSTSSFPIILPASPFQPRWHQSQSVAGGGQALDTAL